MPTGVDAPLHTIPEWAHRDIPDVRLTPRDRRLIDRIGEQGGRLVIDELQQGLRVHTTSWVGVVCIEGGQINVVPKLAGEYIGLVRLLEWVTGFDELTDLESDPRIDLSGTHLLDLVALLLVREVERVLRKGVRSDYVAREEALPVLRGRLLFDRQLGRRHGRLDVLECRYDERSADIFDNRLLLAAVERCAVRTREAGVRRRAMRVKAKLMDICDATGVGLPRRAMTYDRLNAYYRQAHELAWLVLEGTQGLDDLYASGDTRSFAFLLDMNRLFERFVERVLDVAITPRGPRLSFQHRTGSVVQRADTGVAYSQLVPDVLVTSTEPQARWPVDAKYKRYSKRKVDRSDVAQLFLYTASLGVLEGERPPHGLIIYPAESRELEKTPLAVRRARCRLMATVTALGVPIPRLLDEVLSPGGSSDLIDAIAEAVLTAREISRGPAEPELEAAL